MCRKARYSNSDFAYIGFGASQELPYPGKRALPGGVAQHGIAVSRAEKDAVTWDVLTRLKPSGKTEPAGSDQDCSYEHFSDN
jgi:hypothetical protein